MEVLCASVDRMTFAKILDNDFIVFSPFRCGTMDSDTQNVVKLRKKKITKK